MAHPNDRMAAKEGLDGHKRAVTTRPGLEL